MILNYNYLSFIIIVINIKHFINIYNYNFNY